MDRNPYNRLMPGLFNPAASDMLADQSFSYRNGIYQPIREENLLLRDTTLRDVSTTKHGFAPKLPNDATKYLDGTGGYSVPPGTTFTTQDQIDLLWGKKFFSDEGFLTSMSKIVEHVGTPGAFTATPVASWTLEPGLARSSVSGMAYYDLGAAKSKILIVCGNFIKNASNPMAIGISGSAPAGLDPDGYYIWTDTSTVAIWKHNTTYTNLATLAPSTNADTFAGYALYYDDAANVLKAFLRFGSQWFLAATKTSETTFTTLRYFFFQSSSSNSRFITPFVCYAQA